jgi:beta-glucosidase
MKKEQKSTKPAPYLNPDLPIEKRVRDLVSRMTLQEKIGQTLYAAEAIPRLGVPEYNWWGECLHGAARAGIATVFPQSIGMAASFDTLLMKQVATAIGDEVRAKHHEFVRQGDYGIFKGLTMWSPNVNIFRDPRWGRGQETYGEDPYLSGRMGVAFVQGLQGEDPKYLKVVATPKHYAVHSGPEALRHHFDAHAGPKDLRETYLPAFRDCVVEAKAASVMGAYNRTNGEPCCASPTLLEKILRREWGFEGYVVSDCGAIWDIFAHHTSASSPEKAAAMAVNAGCDLNCGRTYSALVEAVKQGLIEEKTIDRAVERLMRARMQLGMFDPPERVPHARIPFEINDCEEHRKLALQMARESMVLLKNKDGLLPLSKQTKCIAVIGPNADDREMLLGNYNGYPSHYKTLLDGIRQSVSENTKVLYARGCNWISDENTRWGIKAEAGFAEALTAVQRAEVIVLCLGLTAELEGEEGSAKQAEWQGDRLNIGLPEIQQRLLEAVAAQGKPVVLVLCSGSPLSVPWAEDHVGAIIEAWYPGQEGGKAVAEVLFGDYSPAGRLPVTVVRSLDQLPPFTDYDMRGRTYRYLEDQPLYPFAYGLSYASFEYASLELSSSRVEAGESLRVSVEVRNSGKQPAEEVIQLYLSDLEASVRVPRWQLAGMRRILLEAGKKQTISFEVSPRQMALIDEAGQCILEPGTFRAYVGGHQPDQRSAALTGKQVLSEEFTVTGSPLELEY